jgi:hypothetical protein
MRAASAGGAQLSPAYGVELGYGAHGIGLKHVREVGNRLL